MSATFQDNTETVGDILKVDAKEIPTRLGLVGLDIGGKEIKKYTYKEYHERATNVAAALIAKKVKPGDRIVLVFIPGTVDAAIAFFACLYCAAIPVCVFPPDPRNLQRDVPKLAKTLQDCNASYVLTNAEYHRYAFRPFSSIKWPPVPWLKLNDLKRRKAAGDFVLPTPDKDGIAFIQYTSGSTSDPKGVIVGHKQALDNIRSVQKVFNDTHPSRKTYDPQGFSSLSWVPHYHDFGLIVNILGTCFSGGSAVLLSPFSFLKSPGLWMQLINKYQPIQVSIPNFALIIAAKKTPPKEKVGLDVSKTMFVVGAEPIRNSSLINFVEAFKECGVSMNMMMNAYGIAEHVLFVTLGVFRGSLRIDKNEFAHGKVVLLDQSGAEDDKAKFCVSLGTPPAHYEVITVDPDTLVPKGELEIGEVWISSASKALGYWNQEQITKDTFHAALAGDNKGKLGDGYFRTGDYGFFHNNEVFLCGRKKDLVIVGGRNYYPQDLEEVAEQANAHIRPGCVIVFEMEVEDQESVVVLSELREPDKLKNDELEKIADDIYKTIVSEFKLNCYAVVLQAPHTIPKTSSGKVSRQPAKKQFVENTLKQLYLKKYQWSDEIGAEAAAPPVDGAGKEQ